MTRREEIVKATKECREYYVGLGRYLTTDDIADAFEEGAEWMQQKIIDRLRELKRVYELDLDAEPRVYERHIQLCAKLSLIEKLIQDLEDLL